MAARVFPACLSHGERFAPEINSETPPIIVILIERQSWLWHYSYLALLKASLHLLFRSALLLASVVDGRDGQERWEGGVMTCDKGCMPDWRVHSMRLSHLSRHNTINTRGLQHSLQLQEELFRLFCRLDAELKSLLLWPEWHLCWSNIWQHLCIYRFNPLLYML